MPPRPRFNTMEEYFGAAAPEAQPVLRKIRQIIETTVPDATPTISYSMPAFRQKRVFIYFAAFKNHIGIYPPVRDDAKLIADLAPYRGEKGNLKFPLAEPMPFQLIQRVVRALAK